MRPIWIQLTGFLLLINLAGAARADETGIALPGPNLLVQAPAVPVLIENQPETDEAVKLTDLFTIAFENNPSIKAARSDWQAMVEMYPQAASLPDPKLNLSWFPEPIETRNGSNDFAFQIMQMFPNPNRLGVMGDIALSRAEMAEVMYEKTVRDVLTGIQSSYFELGYLHRAVDIAGTNKNLFAQLVEFGNLRFAQGEIGASEVYTAESRLAQAEYEFLLLHELIFVEESNLRLLTGVEPEHEFGRVILPVTGSVEFELQNLTERVLEYRHELEMAGISVELADLNVSLARSMDDPDYSVGFMYNLIGTSPMPDGMVTNGDDAWGIMFGINIPIWGGKNNARVEQAASQLDSAEANYQNMSNMAVADVEKLYWKLQNQGRLVELYRKTLLPDAVQAADLAQRWYEGGQISFTGVIESRMVVQNFQLATARAEADYLISLTDLQKLTGIPVFGNEDGEAGS